MVSFIQELSYSGKYDMLSAIHTDLMHQPWRTFVAIINRCISRKSLGHDRLRLSRAQILWGMNNKKNDDFIALLWEDFIFQADNREISSAHKENMPSPKFIKVIINHFISKDKTISKRNRINIHIIRNDTLLEEEHVEKPKRAKKPTKKSTTVPAVGVVIRDTHGVSVSNKKVPTKVDRGKGMDLLSEAALLEAVQLNKTLKQIKLATYKLHASGSGDGFGSQRKVLDESKDKTTGTNEGTSTKPGVLDYPNTSLRVKTNLKEIVKMMIAMMMTVMMSLMMMMLRVMLMVTMKQVIVKRLILMKMRVLISIRTMMKNKNMRKKNNLSPTNTEINSMMNIDVRHEEPTSLTEFELKKILLNKMQKSKLYQEAQEHRDLYDALVKFYKFDKDLFGSYGKAYSLKRDHKDKDEDPLAESDHSKPLPSIKNQVRQVVPIKYFINNDLEYLKGGSLSRKYMTSIIKTKAAEYDDIQGIEDMVPSLWIPMKKITNLEKYVIFNSNVALRMFTIRVIILKRVEDLQLGVERYQKKLNITRPETFRTEISKRTPYTAYRNPQGIIYVDKYKRNRSYRLLALAFRTRLTNISLFFSLLLIILKNHAAKETPSSQSMDPSACVRLSYWMNWMIEIGLDDGESQNRRDLPRDFPLDRIEFLAYDKKEKSRHGPSDAMHNPPRPLKKKDVIQYPRFTKLIIVDLMPKFDSIPKRLEEDYYSIKDDVSLVSVYTTRNVTVKGVLILDDLLTDYECETQEYKDYTKEFVRVDVPTIQPQLIESTQGMNRTPRATRTPNPAEDKPVSIAPPPPSDDRERDDIAKTTLVSIALHKTAKIAEEQGNLAKMQDKIMEEDVEKIIKGEDKESYASKFADLVFLDEEDFGTRLELKSHKENSEIVNGDDEEEKKDDDDNDDHDIQALVGNKVTGSLEEFMTTIAPTPGTTSQDQSKSKPISSKTKKLLESIAQISRRHGQLRKHMKQTFVTKTYFQEKMKEISDTLNNLILKISIGSKFTRGHKTIKTICLCFLWSPNKSEGTSKVRKEFRTLNKEARLSIQHWKDLWHKRMYKLNQRKVRANPKEYFLNHMIVEVVRVNTDQRHGLDYTKQIIVMRENDKSYSFSEADFKYLNKNDIEDMYYLCLNKKVNYHENKLLNSLMKFIKSRVIWEKVHEFHLGIESYQIKINLTAPTLIFLGIEECDPYFISWLRT
uniref:Uncharacterized protein n=1 Tax=Tanacetum cinerariifolium TaxID=118510 RepID=A0A6L2LLV0_TANCI|nr:hypothetical protein [Tanacetum cinerariifolium]